MTATEHDDDTDLAALAEELAAGRLTAREAIDRLVERVAGGAELDGDERAELHALMTDLVEHDPHLGELAQRV